jgi:two-component system chemotaxis response regulator CheB
LIACKPDVPSSSRPVAIDHVLPLEEISAGLVALARQPRPPAGEVPGEIRAEALIAAQELRDMDHLSRSGSISPITCPECHGSLQEIVDGELVRYRCHTGHAFTLETLGAIQAAEWDRALYGAYRAQQERAILLRRMADEACRKGVAQTAQQLAKRAESYEEGAAAAPADRSQQRLQVNVASRLVDARHRLRRSRWPARQEEGVGYCLRILCNGE